MFENDVKIYGIQTERRSKQHDRRFENDVKIYGIQTDIGANLSDVCLRMM